MKEVLNKTDPEQAIRQVKRWLDEIVIGLNLCPFSHKPRRQDQIRFQISYAQDVEQLLHDLYTEIQFLQETPADQVETSLLIIPSMLGDFYDYNQFLQLGDDLLLEFAWEGVFQIASFHPDYCFADTDPQAKENYTNRSPYPILHLLREASIEQAQQQISSTDQIYETNINTLQQLSDQQIKTLFRLE